MRPSSDNALNTHLLHQPRDRAAGNAESLAAQLAPDLERAVDAPVLLEDASDLRPQRLVPARTIRLSGRIGLLCQMVLIGRRGDQQNVADRFDPARRPLSTLAFLTQSFSVCGVQPIFAAIDMTACQRNAY